MNTSFNKYDAIEKIIFDTNLRIQNVEVKPEVNKLLVFLNTKQLLVLPLSLYKTLAGADNASVQQFELIADGRGIHWPMLDEDLSLKGFLKEALQQLVTEKQVIIT